MKPAICLKPSIKGLLGWLTRYDDPDLGVFAASLELAASASAVPAVPLDWRLAYRLQQIHGAVLDGQVAKAPEFVRAYAAGLRSTA